MTNQEGPARVLIYGSCVSRDTFEFLDPSRYSLLRYIARQSLISAFSPADVDDLDLGALSSPFQRRMVLGDIAGSLAQDLFDLGDRTDLILWDLCDERLGVYRHTSGAVVTRSVELVRSGAELRFATWEHIPFGTDDHFALWDEALSRFVVLLEEATLARKVLLLAVPWAARTGRGAATPASFGLRASQANRLYARYNDAVQARGIAVVGLSAKTVRADDDHKWGVAPFHFGADVYTRLAGQINQSMCG
jgi:hypothetical protein